jgi:biopolymer transport protein ExbB/TolQ
MNDNNIESNLLDLMLRAGSSWVLWLMLALSLAALTVMIERIWFFVQERAPQQQLAVMLKVLRDKGVPAALKTLDGMKSMEAAVARTCLSHVDEGIASVEEHKASTIELERMRYEKRIAFLGTLGNNAPFIGLFGTVLGIIRAFQDLQMNSAQGADAVTKGISSALVATGVGLLVALPAVASYNIFVRKIESATASSESHAHQILAFLKREPSASKEA